MTERRLYHYDSAADLIRADQSTVWHPYSPMPNPIPAYPIVAADGVWLTGADSRTLIDGMSSWWAACHGHRHPHLVAAAHRQIDTLPHVMFGGLTHEPAVHLAERLVSLTPARVDKVFFSDSGSVAVEVALKMALQYQRAQGHPERTRLLTWRRGYHGDTQGAMSVCDPEGGMHSLWAGTLTEQIFAPAPPSRGADSDTLSTYAQQLDTLIDDTVAAIIIEPRVQGAGGMRLHDDQLLRELRQLCDKHDILLIADEIATGFGRTGDIFACTGAGVEPDILCVGKALTGGMLSFAATLASDAVACSISTPAGGGALMHGPTFMGNPLAAAVADAALDLVEDGYWRTSVPQIATQLQQHLGPLAQHPAVADVRVYGAIGVVELHEPIDMARATDYCIAHGVWLRPFGRLLYTMPPFISTEETITAICDVIAGLVAEHAERS